MHLVDEIAENIEGALKKLWPYQHLQEAVTSSERRALEKLLEEVMVLPPDSRERRLTEESKYHAKLVETIREVSATVTKELNRLNPGTLPKGSDTPEKLYGLLCRFSRAYAVQDEGKVSSAERINIYLLSASYDHAWWLWNLWIGAAIAVGDFETSEYLLEVEKDSHDFAKYAKRFHPHYMHAKAMICLKRDEDVQAALEWSGRAKGAYGDGESVKIFRAIQAVSNEKTLTTDHVPAVALITGNWGETSCPTTRRIASISSENSKKTPTKNSSRRSRKSR